MSQHSQQLPQGDLIPNGPTDSPDGDQAARVGRDDLAADAERAGADADAVPSRPADRERNTQEGSADADADAEQAGGERL